MADDSVSVLGGNDVILGATIAVFVIAVAVFHVILLRPGRLQLSSRLWEAVDYIWYFVALSALVIGSTQVIAAMERSRHEEQLRAVERHYAFLDQVIAQRQTLVTPGDTASRAFLVELGDSIRETQFTAGWPLGPICHNGRVFDSMNLLISDLARDHGLTQVDGLVVTLSTVAMDMVSAAREAERKLGHFNPPLWVTVSWPFLLAVVIALRMTKVTFKVRKEK